jgi:hypothetical protein
MTTCLLLTQLPVKKAIQQFSGDFNIDINKDPSSIPFLKEELNLDYIPTPSPTTLGHTTIDLTFARNISIDTMPFVSYFSYHRPIIHKVAIEY